MTSNEKGRPPVRFDPFANRACRKVRNDLAHNLVTAISTRSFEPVSVLIHNYLSGKVTAPIHQYLIDRRERYRKVFTFIRETGVPNEDIWRIAITLWDARLFFEVHEWLEQAWHQSAGDAKESYQAVIRAAGVYIHLEAGRSASAFQLAAKATDGLSRHRNLLPAYFDVTRLLSKLDSLDPVPPKLTRSLPAGT